MANIKGGRAARKRDRQNAKANKRNSSVKTRLHDDHKKLFKAADAGKKEDAELCAKVMFNQALLTEGSPLEDPAGFAKSVTELLVKSL